MARELKKYNWKTNPLLTAKHYPWDKWTNGSTWKAFTDKDFPCKPGTFRVQLSQKAKKMGEGWKVRTSLHEDGVVFQFYKVDSAT